MEPAYPACEWRRIMRIKDIFAQAYRKSLTWKEAAEVLGVNERTLRRWKHTIELNGYEGILDRRRQRPSPKRAPDNVRSQITRLYQDLYREWNVKHFHEQLHKYRLPYSYTWTKNVLQNAQLVPVRSKRTKHRRKRDRKPLPGMMLHIDGSEHVWIPDLGFISLIVLMDDATSHVYYAKLVAQENTRECLAALRHTIATYGLFCSLYSDRATQFFCSPAGSKKIDPSFRTQIGSALAELGITMIPAYSPEARGRSERLFGTWQGRLPNELRFHKINNLPDANRYLWESFIPWHNQNLTVKASSKGSAFSPYRGRSLDLVLSIRESRQVQADNTLRWNKKILQLEPNNFRISFAKCKVMVHEHLDLTLSVVFGPHVIGRFNQDGTPFTHKKSKTKKRTNHLLHKPDILTCH